MWHVENPAATDMIRWFVWTEDNVFKYTGHGVWFDSNDNDITTPHHFTIINARVNT